MPSLPLPFNGGMAPSIEELAGAPPLAINVLADGGGALYTRPGIVEWEDWADPTCNDTGAGPIIGAVVWPSPSGDRLVYVTEATDGTRKLWAMLGPNNRIALSDTTAATQLDGTLRPTFAVTKSRVIIAGGGAPQKWEGAGLSARLGGSPPNISHINANSTRLIGSAPEVGGFEFWSETGETPGHETWDTTFNVAEAEARPDKILATHENSNEVFAFGETSTQLFIPDPNAGYITGRTSNFGIIAPYSVIRVGETFLLLDDQRQFIATGGRGETPTSNEALAKTLQRFATVDDCWGFRCRIDAWDLAVWVFPTEGRTIVYDLALKQWSEWRSRSNGEWSPWVATSYVFWKSRAVHLVGMPDGTMARLDADTFQDDGEDLVGFARTGFTDRGSKEPKTCARLDVTMRRGGNADPVPELSVRWRDGLGAFSQPLRISLGSNSDTDATVTKWTLGMYTSRQWEISFSANARFVLAAVTETFEEAP